MEEREELDKRFPFTPDPHPETRAEIGDYAKDVKRIRKLEELYDAGFLGGEVFGMIDLMMMCAGHPKLISHIPLNTKFLYAIRRIHDWHNGRTIPTDEEWSRLARIKMLVPYVREVLDVIDEERKAGWPCRKPPNYRRIGGAQ